MQRTHKPLVLLAILATAVASCSSSGDEVGTITLEDGALTAADVDIPEVEIADLDPVLRLPLELDNGDEIVLADYLGTPTVVNLWASWCAFCIAEMPDFEAVYQDLRPAVAFVGINIDSANDRAAADRLAVETGVTYDIAFDPNDNITEALGSIAMPATAFVDAKGEILEIHNGQLSAEQLRNGIDELLLGSG